VRLTRQRLNRTLLRRQHLLERTAATPAEMARHLVGLQAQENLPPYLSLHARLSAFDPYDVTRGLEDRSLVRLLTMRGTIHLLVRDDALSLRGWTQQVQEREVRSSQNVKGALGVDREAFARAVSDVLADGPLPQRELSARLGEHFPDAPPAALGQLARIAQPLAQLPPRGAWKASGGVVYQYVDRWVGEPMHDPDVEGVVRRYLAAFGPASAADVTAWSGITRLGPVLAGMPDLVRHEDEAGKVLYDVPDGVIEDEDAPAPPRLLGTYDNVWLSHAGRDRVTEPEKRSRWMGVNGGVAMSLFVGGWLEGLWKVVDGKVEIIATFRDLTRREQSDLDDEVGRVESLLAL
jgi:winged helix DNA-binding protein